MPHAMVAQTLHATSACVQMQPRARTHTHTDVCTRITHAPQASEACVGGFGVDEAVNAVHAMACHGMACHDAVPWHAMAFVPCHGMACHAMPRHVQLLAAGPFWFIIRMRL